jgi:hypothetical protein
MIPAIRPDWAINGHIFIMDKIRYNEFDAGLHYDKEAKYEPIIL